MIWKKVEGFPYEVSDEGQVRRVTTKRLRKLDHNQYGHSQVLLSRNKTKKKFSVHTLMLEAFVGPRPGGMEATHLDGNPKNNVISNLAWRSHLDNMRDKHKHGTMPLGQKHPNSIFTDEQYHEILSSSDSHQVVADRYGVSKSTIAGIRRRHRIRQELLGNYK